MAKKGVTGTVAAELANIRKSIEEVEKLRISAVKRGREEDILRLEEASAELVKKERVIVKRVGEEAALKIKSDGESLKVLSEKLKARVKRMGRLPKRLDTISKIILKISDLINL